MSDQSRIEEGQPLVDWLAATREGLAEAWPDKKNLDVTIVTFDNETGAVRFASTATILPLLAGQLALAAVRAQMSTDPVSFSFADQEKH